MRRKLGEILLSSGVVSPSDIADALSDQSAGEPSRLGDLLVAQGKLTPTQLAQALAEQYGVPFTTLPPLATAVLETVPLDFQRINRLVPIRVDGTRLSVAMADLANSDAVDALKEKWPEVEVFAAPGDEIDALHSALSGEAPFERPPPSDKRPSVDDLFGGLDLDVAEAGRVPFATESALFGDLDLDPAPSGSATFEIKDDAPSQSPSGVFELRVDEPKADGGEAAEVLKPSTETEVPDDVPRAVATTADEGEDDLFFEARPTAPSAVPVAPPPRIAPVSPAPAAMPVVGARPAGPSVEEINARAPSGDSAPPPRDETAVPRGPSLLEHLFDDESNAAAAPSAVSPPGPEGKAAADPPPPAGPESAPRPVARPDTPEKRAEARAARKAEPKAEKGGPEKNADGLELPDWLRGDASPVPSVVDEASADLWTGELEALAPSRLITGVARALIRKRILTEQDVLEALERKKP
jgi:hypothetical protein